MLQVLTGKIQLFPSEEDIIKLRETRTAYMHGCNLVSELVFKSFCLNKNTLQKQIYFILRAQIGLKAQMAISVISTVVARYQSAKTNGHEWTLIKFTRPDYDIIFNKDYSFIKSGVFSIITIQGRIKFPYINTGFEQYFDKSWRFGTGKLVNKHGKWFLHIPFSKEIPDAYDHDICNLIGVDFGINFLATAYNGTTTTFYNGRPAKNMRAKYKRLRKQLQKRKTSSSRRRLKAVGERESRWMTDVNHCVSKALVTMYGRNTLFVHEDLTGIRTATEKVNLKNRYISVSWAFYQLRSFLEYKAVGTGSKTLAVDPSYTSQECPMCGYIAKSNRNKKSHTFQCGKCGYKSNDDRIGGMNLYGKGIEYLLSVASQVNLVESGGRQPTYDASTRSSNGVSRSGRRSICVRTAGEMQAST